MKPEGQFGIRLRRERDTTRPGKRQTWRGDVDLAAQFLAAQRQGAGDLPDAFVGDKKIVDAKPHVVPGRVEHTAALGRELGDTGQRRAWIRKQADLFDRQATRVRVERVRSVPADERRAPHGTAGLDDLGTVEPNTVDVEAERCRRLLEAL